MALHPNYIIRQFAALTCASILAWDYFRDPNVIESFSIWVIALHFVYFQLPVKSKALSILHAASLLGSIVIPVQYAHVLFWNPLLEINNSQQWEMPFFTIVVRSILLHLVPMLLHALDITSNQVNLVNSYRTKRPRFLMLWSLLSLPTFGFIYEFTFPDNSETMDTDGIDRNDFLKINKVLSLGAMLFTFSLLYFLIMRPAFRGTMATDSNISSPHSPRKQH